MDAQGILPVRSWLRAPQALDVVAASVLATIGLTVALADRTAGPIVLTSGVVFCATVAGRRRAPAAACALALAATSVYTHLGGAMQAVVGPLVLILDFYGLGAFSRRSGVFSAFVLALAVPVIATTPGDGHVVDVVTVWLFFAGLPFCAGRLIASRRALALEVAESAERARVQQVDRLQTALLDERLRIARELHDVVAHHVSVMVIQAVAARRVAADDPSAAREAMAAVDSCGREALREMERMVGVVGTVGGGRRVAIGPGLSQLTELADRARVAGLQIDVRIDGDAMTLPAEVDLAAYRLVQEALTNTIKHAQQSSVRVVVGYGSELLRLEVTDTGPRNTTQDRRNRAAVESGRGLTGMAERLAVIGGRVDAGPRPRGGYRVRAEIPLVAAER